MRTGGTIVKERCDRIQAEAPVISVGAVEGMRGKSAARLYLLPLLEEVVILSFPSWMLWGPVSKRLFY